MKAQWFVAANPVAPLVTPGAAASVGSTQSPATQPKDDVKTPPAPEVQTDPLKKPVSLTKPYPTVYVGAPTDKVSVQYAVMFVAKQVGLDYDFESSQKNTDPICRQWVYPAIQNKAAAEALREILEPVGLTYVYANSKLTLKRK